MTNLSRIFSKYFYLILLAFLFECIFNKITSSTILNLIENILFTIALIIPLYFFNKKFKKYYFIISYLVFSICIYFETVYYYLFNTSFSSSAIFVALDTNPEEAKEFISFYIDKTIIIFGIVILTTTLITLLKVKNKNFKIKSLGIKMLGLTIVILLFLKFSGLIIYNLPYMAVRSAVEYYVESEKLGDYINNKIGNFVNVSRTSNEGEQEIYVIIIGESTARAHLGIYDYYRNTTPLLTEIENELLIYNNVISPETYTIASLTKALTLGNYENPDGKYKGSIIQLLNQAKYKTYWISNQRPLGVNDSHVTKIGLGADSSTFFNIKHTRDETNFDKVLVDEFNEILLEKGNKKVIFLHTLGTHFNYKNRYPESFNFFNNDIPKSKFKRESVYNEINYYDNAVRYTDYIIRTVIESTKKVKANSFVLYFSDHGEEVYDDIDFSGHFRDRMRTKNVYEIPMILWLSKDYKLNKNIYKNLDSKYMIDDIFHSIADLCGVISNEVDFTRSIFSNQFKERKRIIKDTIDYDAFFKLD